MKTLHPIHPFPARMAPDIALEECTTLSSGSTVLDPMVGSGVVARAAAENGHRAIGFDMDPLAVLMSRVWTTPLPTQVLLERAENALCHAEALTTGQAPLPWIDEDTETTRFVDYWFAPPQQADLRRLSYVLHQEMGAVGDALRLSLSRIIITKDRGASLARDVSHSRPHRAYDSHDFPVFREFLRSVRRLSDRLNAQPPPGNVEVHLGDARRLAVVESGSVDAVITSPPYLNAIDYLRGHRLALVWLGHSLPELRAIRANSIGAERSPDAGVDRRLAQEVRAAMEATRLLPSREQGMLERYILDLFGMISELHRVLRTGGTAVFVVGNSWIRGVFVENTRAVITIAERIGFRLISQQTRILPASQRYLPPPTHTQKASLQRRMRTENVVKLGRL